MSLIANALDRAQQFAESTRLDCRMAVKGGDGLGAAVAMSPGAVTGASYGRFSQSQAHHSEQYSFFSGYPYSIINIIANRLAAQPIKLARILPAGDRARKQLRPVKELLPKGMQELAGRMEVLEDHRIIRVINDPNPIMIRHHLLYSTFASQEITGFGYWWMYTDDAGKDFIWPVPVHWIEPVHEPNKLFAYYKLQIPGAGAPIKVPTRQIVRFVVPDPSDPFAGLAPLQANARTVMTDFAIEMAQRMSFENGINPGLAIMVGKPPEFAGVGGDQMMLTKEQREQLIAAVKRRYRGVTRFDEPMILDALIKDVKQITTSPREMGFKDSSILVRNRMTQGWGMNPITMGEMEGVNYASSGAADLHVCRNVYSPRTESNSQTMSCYVLPYFGGNKERLVLYQEAVEPTDPEHDLAKDYGDYDRGIKSRNELRLKRGLPAVANGNFALTGAGWVEVDPDGKDDGNPGGSVDYDDPDEDGDDDLDGGGDGEQGSDEERTGPRTHRESVGRPFSWWHWGMWDTLDRRLRVKTGRSLAETVKIGASVVDRQQGIVERTWRRRLRAAFAKLGAKASARLLAHLKHGHDVSPREATHAAVSRKEWEKELTAVLEPLVHEAALRGAAAEWTLFRASKKKKGFFGSLPKRILNGIKDVAQSVMDKGIVKAVVDGVVEACRRAIKKILGTGAKGDDLAKQVSAAVFIGDAAENAAEKLTRTEGAATVNAGQRHVRIDLERGGAVTVTEWVTREDERVRHTHAKAHGQRVRPGKPFTVGGHQCYFPGDPSLPVSERAHCRCVATTIYVPSE
jgi:phage portal protein BeeE